MVAAVLVRQCRFDGGFGLFRQLLRLIQHSSHHIHGSRISSQFFLYIEDKGQSRFLGKVEDFLVRGVYVKSMRLQLSFIMLSSLPLNVGSF